jgi:tape measure domain-containing protein
VTDITVSVGVDSKGAEQGAARVGRSLDDIRKRSKQVEDQSKRTSLELGRLGAVLKTAIGAAAVRQVGQYADTYKNLESRLKTVTRTEAELNRVRREALQIANQTRSSLEGTVTLYTRVARNVDQLGISQEKVLRVTELTNKAIQIGGSSAQEAAAGVIQFAQALASGRLQGDELRSILENMPVLAKAISDGLGVTIGDLRRMGAEGELTAKKIVEALLSQGAAMDASFGKVNVTVGQAFTVLNNHVIDAIGRLDQAVGASAALANAILFLAEHVDELGTVAGAVAVVFAARFAPSVVGATVAMAASARAALTYAAAMVSMGGAAGVAATAMRGLSVSMAFLGGPLGIAIIAVSGAMYALSQSSDVAEKSQRALHETMGKFAGYSDDIIGASAEQRKQIIADATKRLEAHTTELRGVTALARAYAVMSNRERLTEEIGTRIGNLFRSEDKETPLEVGKRFLALSGAVKEMGESLKTLKAIDANGGRPLARFSEGSEEAEKKAKKLQDTLEEIGRRALFEQQAVGLEGAALAALEFDTALAELTRTYGPLSEAQLAFALESRRVVVETAKAGAALEAQEQAMEEARKRADEMRREFLRKPRHGFLDACAE